MEDGHWSGNDFRDPENSVRINNGNVQGTRPDVAFTIRRPYLQDLTEDAEGYIQ